MWIASKKQQRQCHDRFKFHQNNNGVCFWMLLSFVWALILSNFVVDASLSTTIPNGGERCFIVITPSESMSVISGDFELLDEWKSANALVARIFSFQTHKMVWSSKPGASENDFSIRGQGKFHLCFSNGYVIHPEDEKMGKKDGQSRTVGFNIRVQPYNVPLDETGPMTQRVAQLLEASEDMHHHLNVLLDHVENMKTREHSQDDLASQTQNRLLNWTIIHCIALSTMAVVQVIFWKRHFEQL